MQGAQRNASVLRREAMRRHLVTSKSRAEAYERVLPASVVRFGCGRPMADRNRARVALCDSNQRPGIRRFSLCPMGDQFEACSTWLEAGWRSGDRSPREMIHKIGGCDRSVKALPAVCCRAWVVYSIGSFANDTRVTR
jgi:hypothetical protein